MIINLNILKKIFKYFGFDSDVLSIVINRAWSVLKGPITTVFQIMFLTKEHQGLWYTFISLGALTSFAELGFTTIIAQFVSHEYVYTRLENGNITGEKKHVDKLFDLIRFSIKFYVVVVPIAVVIISIVGLGFFYKQSGFIKFAWVLYAISGGINLMVSLFQAIFQGLNKIIDIQKNIFVGSIVTTFLNWCLLAAGFNIFALAICNLAGAFVSIILLYKVAPNFWRDVFRSKIEVKHHWAKEIIPLQLKYAISFISGYFMFNFFAPVIFKVDGSIPSGQVGMTFIMSTSIINVAYAWIDAKIPKMNMLAESQSENELWILFKKLLKKCFSIAIIGIICLYVAILILQRWSNISERFVSPEVVFLILIFQIVNFITGSVAKCLRVYKEEPFCNLSIFSAVVTTIILLLIYPHVGLIAMFVVIDVVYLLIMLPWTLNILNKYRKKKLLNIYQ